MNRSLILVTMFAAFVVLCGAALPLKVSGQTIYTIADGDVNGLINAINSSNASPGGDVINLAAHGNYALTSVAEDDGYSGAAGLPYIKRPVTINGNGATIQRSSAVGVPDFRIIYVLLSDLTLNQVTIKGGRGGNVNRGGGGIGMIGSNLAIDGSTITENVNFGSGGGGIGSFISTFTIKNSTISYNFSDSGYGGGGIVDFASSTTSTIVSSTIFENRNIAGRGDAIANAFSTGTIVVKNSILASPTNGVSDDCYSTAGVLISEGHNIVSDATCSLNGVGDMNNTNPLLGPLADNGGPTATHALLPGGPAIDAIPIADCTTIAGVAISQDQRGLTRPFGSGCDIGAYEYQVTDSTPPVITPAVTGTLGDDGWYTGNVDINWQVSDPESSISDSTDCTVAHVITDTSGVTFTCSATSGGGHSTSSVTIKRDATAPVVSCGSADGAWHAADVTIGCSSNDGTSGLLTSGDANFNLSTSISTGTETSNASTNSRQVCDLAGNCAVAGAISGIKVDKKAPVISLVSPVAGNYLLNQSVIGDFTCTDGGSGIASCVGTSASGAPINTSSTGAKTFTVTSADNVGNTAIPSVVSYQVNFGLSVLFDQSKAAQSGSTVPIKVRLVDANGVNVSSSATVLHAISVFQTSSQASTVLDDAGAANPDFDFRYDASLGGYIFNLKTTGYGTGSYVLNFVSGNSPTVYSVRFQIRQ